MPNHIFGGGVLKLVRESYPHVQVLTLDFDPDTSMANIENRLQMLIMNARELDKLRAQDAGTLGSTKCGTFAKVRFPPEIISGECVSEQ